MQTSLFQIHQMSGNSRLCRRREKSVSVVEVNFPSDTASGRTQECPGISGWKILGGRRTEGLLGYAAICSHVIWERE